MTDASGITPASDELVAELEAHHTRLEERWPEATIVVHCGWCGESWPCPSAQVLARLREAESKKNEWREDHNQAVEQRDAALARVEALEADRLRLLVRYGVHDNSCSSDPNEPDYVDEWCTCGYSAEYKRLTGKGTADELLASPDGTTEGE